MNILFSVFQSRELQTLDTDSRVEDQREASGNEKTTHRRKNISKHWGEINKENGMWKELCDFQGPKGLSQLGRIKTPSPRETAALTGDHDSSSGKLGAGITRGQLK